MMFIASLAALVASSVSARAFVTFFSRARFENSAWFASFWFKGLDGCATSRASVVSPSTVCWIKSSCRHQIAWTPSSVTRFACIIASKFLWWLANIISTSGPKSRSPPFATVDAPNSLFLALKVSCRKLVSNRAIFGGVSIPEHHYFLGLCERCKAPSQLHYVFAHRIFNDLFLLYSED